MLHKVKLTTFLLLFFCFLSFSYADQRDFQLWVPIVTNVKLGSNSKFLFTVEAQPRIGDNVSNIERLLIRPSLSYNINDNLMASLGYAWTPTYMNSTYDSDFRNESRIWQQLLYKNTYEDFKFQNRLRLEQRYIEDAKDVSNRVRHLFRISKNLSCEDTYGLTFYNEFFFNLNTVSNGPSSSYDRDRFFIGPYLQDKNSRYEFGYLGEHAKKFGKDGRYINAILLSATYNF